VQNSRPISRWIRAAIAHASSPRLAKIAAGLLGVRSVRLYDDQALYKEAGGAA
jgi:hypothetical protein